MMTKSTTTETPPSTQAEDINPPQEQLHQHICFPTIIYSIQKPEFLNVVKTVSDEYINKVKLEQQFDEIYPAYMSDSYYNDPRLNAFSDYVSQTAWNILQAQGYAMENVVTQFSEMWTQEHYKHSLMEQHAHGFGSQLVGFYFLETPKDCSRILFHDPRPAKTQINLPETNLSNITYGSNLINYEPTPGMLIFTNSWLPHSFGRHRADDPIKFVHFNIIVNAVLPEYQSNTFVQKDVKNISQVFTTPTTAEVI